MQDAYRQSVRTNHQSRVVRGYFDFYAWFWFHTEFWLAPEERRPYTFIFRDWIFPHKNIFWVISAVWFLGIMAWVHWNPYGASVTGMLTICLWAHLVWGSDWVPGEKL